MSRYLTEDKDSGPLRPHVLEEFIEDDHISRIIDEVLVDGVGWTGLLHGKLQG
jgi:hypothetical protein